MPSFEYVDLYTNWWFLLVDKMFQYINHEGKNVAMRVDFLQAMATCQTYANSANEGEARYSYFGKSVS